MAIFRLTTFQSFVPVNQLRDMAWIKNIRPLDILPPRKGQLPAGSHLVRIDSDGNPFIQCCDPDDLRNERVGGTNDRPIYAPCQTLTTKRIIVKLSDHYAMMQGRKVLPNFRLV